MSGPELIPAWPAPPGLSSNFKNPEGIAGKFVGLAIFFLTLSVIVVTLRLYTQIVILRRPGLDDYVMLLAAVLAVMMTGFAFNLLRYGLGHHIWDVPLSSYSPHFLKSEFVVEALYFLSTTTAKIAILLYYLRIFTGRNFKIITWSLIIVCVLHGIVIAIVTLFGCRPIAAAWDVKILEPTCIDRRALYFAKTGMSIFFDFATFLLPLPQLLKLQLPWKQKIGVAALLTAGALVCVMSIIRTVAVAWPSATVDLTFNLVGIYIWCLVELHVSIIGGSLPVMRPFVRQYFPRLLDLATSRKTTSNTNNIAPGSHTLSHRLNPSGTLRKPGKAAVSIGSSMPRRDTSSYRKMSGSDRPTEDFQNPASEEEIGLTPRMKN